MAGNIYEWCYDWYGADYYAVSPKENPTGPETGVERVRRGGCWAWGPELLRNASRGRRDPMHRGKHVGFRCARSCVKEKGVIAGLININPNNSDQNLFVLTLPDGKTITRDNLAGRQENYSGPATVVHVRPHGNGNQNGLSLDGEPYRVVNADTYDITGGVITVNLYRQDADAQGNKMGQWWISIAATNAAISVTEAPKRVKL